MSGPVQLYTIFWSPPKLQTGAASGLPASYVTILNTLATTYPDHGIDNNNTQYYSVSGSKTTYIANAGGHSGSFQDKAAYPASGCSDSVTPGNCLVDSQIQAEVAHAMAVNGWTGGLTKMFLVFTDPGEGSCFTSSSSSCAYTSYCAYHSYFFSGSGEPVIYGNEPYGDPNHCQASGTPSPHGNAAADTAATAASHEISEAITDPELSSWYTLAGSEIGDLCAYIYGTNTWDGGLANQMWAGTFWELQMEWDNHFNGCVQVGP